MKITAEFTEGLIGKFVSAIGDLNPEAEYCYL